MTEAASLSAPELAALLLFHADCGVDWMLEDTPVDRFAEFQARSLAPAAAAPAPAAQSRSARTAPAAAPARAAPSGNGSNGVTIPDAQAVADARYAAEGATTLAELKAAMEGFSGCNLKISARSTVFADGNAESGIMVIGPMPTGEDDREGRAFSGKAGTMLEHMLKAIGLDRETALLTQAIAWRPPGNRMPSVQEAEICRPFIERQVTLVRPRHVLLLGNFTARLFLGDNETIHSLRGRWHAVTIAGHTFQALATWHPQDLIAAPANKQAAWHDLLVFRDGLDG